jgi:hypothetical protein
MRRPERRRRSDVLASGTFDGEINLWDIDKQKEIASFANERRSVYGLALSADGKKPLSSCGADVILKDTVKGMPLGRFMGNKGSAMNQSISALLALVAALHAGHAFARRGRIARRADPRGSDRRTRQSGG